MKQYFLIPSLVILAILFVTGCRETPPIGKDEKGPITLNFDNMVGSEDLVLNGAQTYTNANGDKYNVTLLNYFISNIQLKNAKGETYTVPQDKSYFLVQESNAASQMIKLTDVPAADYTQITFVLGVDSLRNTKDLSERTGVLDPATYTGDNAMYWTWNSGYIFFKMEGLSPQAPTDPGGFNKYRFHIGGYGGYSSQTINNIKTITLDFPNDEKAVVREDRNPEVHFGVDIQKVMNGTTNVSLANNATVMFSTYSVNIANNYTSAFSVEHVHND